MGKDKKSHKDKKPKKDKKRKREREYSSDEDSSGSDGEHRRQKAQKLTKKVQDYWEKRDKVGGAAAPPRFVWVKKVEKDLQEGKSVKEFTAKAEQHKHIERMAEIEKVQKRREEREAEKARMEEELALLQRQRAAAEAVEQEEREDEFHLKQAQVRAARRIAEGRAKPIDLITRNLFMLGTSMGPDQENEAGAGLAEDFDADLLEPHLVFDGLPLEEVRDLYDDIRMYKDLDTRDPLHVEYWQALSVLGQHELAGAEERDAADRAHLMGQAPAVPAAVPAALGKQVRKYHTTVEREIEGLLSGQTYAQLMEMQENINAQLASGQGDPEYWEQVLSRLTIHAAKARLREIQTQLLEVHLDKMERQANRVNVAKAMGWARERLGEMEEEEEEEEEEEREEGEPGTAAVPNAEEVPLSDDEGEEGAAGAATGPPQEPPSPSARQAEAGPSTTAAGMAEAAGPSRGAAAAAAAAHDESDGRHSPPPLEPAEVAGLDVVNAEDDARMLQLLRQQVALSEAVQFHTAADIASRPTGLSAADLAYQQALMDQRPAPKPGGVIPGEVPAGSHHFRGPRVPGPNEPSEQEKRLRAAAMKAMGDGEGDAPFGGEVPLDNQVYWWHNKHAPRKPKYFNRIHTGYEWNKYNQTHYDTDNPPPKVVQGYKFNIFYPDLLDKSVAPTYKIQPDPSGSRETCILVFSAGPPYEDIAFRIINKEWETTHRRGFKSTYERGILHLYFNFKRARYRR